MVEGEASTPRPLIVRTYEFLNPRGDDAVDSWEERWGLQFENFIMVIIGLNVVTFALSTVDEINQNDTATAVFGWFETCSVLIFTMELIVRIWSSPGQDVEDSIDNPSLTVRPPWRARLGYVLSFYGLIDLAAVVPWYIDQALPNESWRSTNVIRVVRLSRMLRGPQAQEAESMLKQVFTDQREVLTVTLYAACALWLVFAVLMYLSESDDHDEVNGLLMSQRYGTIPNSLWYTLVHLTGDFPLVDYSICGKLVLAVMILAAVAVVCLPAGIYADAFQDLMTKRAKALQIKEENERKMVLSLQQQQQQEGKPLLSGGNLMYYHSMEREKEGRGLHSHPETKSAAAGRGQKKQLKLSQVVSDEPAAAAAAASSSQGLLAERSSGDYDDGIIGIHPTNRSFKMMKKKTIRAQTYDIVFGVSQLGTYVEWIILSTIGIATVSFVLSTVEELNHHGGEDVFYYIEAVCVGIFTLEYICRLWSCVEDPVVKRKAISHCYSRWLFCTCFFSIIDLASILPFYVDLALGPGNQLENTSAIRALRLFRVLQAEKYVAAFSMFNDVWEENKYILMYTGVLALILWIAVASMFWLLEAGNPNVDGAFDTVPNSLFMTAIFMGGEWAETDFTPGGKVLGVFMCWVAINLFAVPIGIIASGFEAVSTRERKKKKRLGLNYWALQQARE